jgi:hypothetical protein
MQWKGVEVRLEKNGKGRKLLHTRRPLSGVELRHAANLSSSAALLITVGRFLVPLAAIIMVTWRVCESSKTLLSSLQIYIRMKTSPFHQVNGKLQYIIVTG